jgi:protein TonB
MFEGSLIKKDRTKTPAGMVIAIAGQVSAISLAVLIPLVYTDHLPAFTTPASIAVPKGKPDPGPIEIKPAGQKGAQVVRPKGPTPFVAPVRIPEKVSVLIDQPGAASNAPYVPGGIGDGAASAPGLPLPLDSIAPPVPKAPEPKAAPPTVKRVRVGGAVQAAQIVKRVIPLYPALAKQARIQGTVKLIGVIATDGTVQQLRTISGHPLLVQAALDAVRQWVYRPTLLNGEPVEVEAPIDVNFTLAQ